MKVKLNILKFVLEAPLVKNSSAQSNRSGAVCLLMAVFAEESQGEIEVKDPCACESLVEFQQATMSSLEQLTHKHILDKVSSGEAASPHRRNQSQVCRISLY